MTPTETLVAGWLARQYTNPALDIDARISCAHAACIAVYGPPPPPSPRFTVSGEDWALLNHFAGPRARGRHGRR